MSVSSTLPGELQFTLLDKSHPVHPSSPDTSTARLQMPPDGAVADAVITMSPTVRDQCRTEVRLRMYVPLISIQHSLGGKSGSSNTLSVTAMVSGSSHGHPKQHSHGSSANAGTRSPPSSSNNGSPLGPMTGSNAISRPTFLAAPLDVGFGGAVCVENLVGGKSTESG